MVHHHTRFRRSAIRELIDKEQLSASAFARRLHVSKTLVGGWLSGLVTPQIATLTRMCAVFNVPIDFFFESVGAEECQQETAK